MVDATAADEALPHALQQQLMRLLEHRLILHADRGKIVDVEKSPIIDLLRGHLPGGEPIRLFVEERVEEIEAFRTAAFAVEDADIVRDERSDGRTLLHER